MKKLKIQTTHNSGWYKSDQTFVVFECEKSDEQPYGDTDYYLAEDFFKTTRRLIQKEHTIVIEKNTFDKSDLRTGMIIVTKKGSEGVVMLNTIKGDIIASDGCNKFNRWCELDHYKNDLTYQYCPHSDIVQVWESNRSDSNRDFLVGFDKGTLLWEREKPKIELTMEQIAKKFDIDIEQLIIKK